MCVLYPFFFFFFFFNDTATTEIYTLSLHDALPILTTLQAHSPYWQSALWLALVGVGSGVFNSPNTAAMMAIVPANRRGIAGAARMLLTNAGAVLSIAFVLAVVTSAVPKAVLFKIFSGLASGLSNAQLAPFIEHMHLALWVL